MNTPTAPPSPAPQTTWPLVIGIISLVVGIGAAVAYGCMANLGMAMVFFLEDFFKKMAEQQPSMAMSAAQMQALREWAPAMMVVQTIVGLNAILLIVGGTKLLRRRRGARGFCLTWAALRMTIAVPAVTLGFFMNQAMFHAMQDAAAGSNPLAGNYMAWMNSLGWVSVAVGLVWRWAYPVFLIVWMSRAKIRDEMAGWE